MVNTEIRLIIFVAKKQKLYRVRKKTRLGTDCGSDHKLVLAKFRHNLKKVGKSTRLFRYDINQITYEYTMEVTDSRD